MELSLQRRLRVFALLSLAAPIIAAVFGVSTLLVPKSAIAAQTIPYKVNFQGRLTDNSGNILSDGLYNIKFRFMDALTTGTNKFEEDRVIIGTDNRVQVANGLFNIQFGDVTALSPTLFSGAFPLYLEVELPTPATANCATNGCAVFTEGPMTPRQALASSAYAFNSDTLDGLDSTAFAQLSATQTFTGTNSFQPTTNISSALIKQNSSGLFATDIFTVSGSSSGNFIQVTSTAANQGAVTVQSLGANALILQSGSGTLSLGSTTLVNSTGASLAFNSAAAAPITLDSGTIGNVNIGTDTISSKTINIGPTATNPNPTSISIGTNIIGTQNVDIGSTGSGNAAAGTNVNIQGGTGTSTAIVLGTNGAGGIVIDTGTTGAITIGTNANAKDTTVGSVTGASVTAILGGATGSVGIGSVGSSILSSTVNIGNTNNATGTQIVSIGSNALAANALTLEAGNSGKIQIGNSAAAHTIQIGANGAAAGNAQIVVVGSGSTTTAGTVTLQGGNLTSTNGNSGIVIGGGYSITDTNLVGLTLDSTTTFNETASTCSTSVNDGTLYYNAAQSSGTQGGSMAVRVCTNGNWEDLVSTAGLGIMLFGVVPDSGNNPGDLTATITSGVTGPCKVSWATSTTVTVAPCTAYSGGRKVVVSSTTLSTTNATLGNYQHVCLTGTNNAPSLTTSATEATGQPAFSINNPIICLADIAFAAANNTISQIFDTRAFTNSQKEFVSSAAALGLGWPACPSGQQATTCAVAVNDSVMGIVAATTGVVGAGGVPNVILVTGGPTLAKPNLTAVVAGDVVGSAATANRLTATILPNGVLGTVFDANLGIARNASPATACTATASAVNCNYQLFFDQQKR